jgi:hypothetical protein
MANRILAIHTRVSPDYSENNPCKVGNRCHHVLSLPNSGVAKYRGRHISVQPVNDVRCWVTLSPNEF